MSTVQDIHEGLLSAEYLDALAETRKLIEGLRRESALSLPGLVWRARTLYHQAWQDEKLRKAGNRRVR